MMCSLTSSLFILAAQFFYINEAVLDMKENPKQDSKIVSQALFSEELSIQETSDNWIQIVTPDGYTGWVLKDKVITLSEPYQTHDKTSRLKAHVYGVKDTEYGPVISLPYNTKLNVVDRSDPRWCTILLPNNQKCYIQKGDLASEPTLSNKRDLCEFSKKFLGLPYTWGGRSSFGYDCSGFIQMLYNQIGISLQRDARLQIQDNRLQEVTIDELEPGDLLFFGKSDQKIKHVGMYLRDKNFIHACTTTENKPWIRISNLTDFEWSGDKNAYYPFRTFRKLDDGK
jgi:gamma-D-glutamyl-L-lysine dipeptidyl-peptidase